MAVSRLVTFSLASLVLGAFVAPASAGIFVSIGPLSMGIGHPPGHTPPPYNYGFWGNSCANVGCTSAECGGPGYPPPGYGPACAPQPAFPYAAPAAPCGNCGNPVGSTGYGYYPNSTTYWNQGIQRR